MIIHVSTKSADYWAGDVSVQTTNTNLGGDKNKDDSIVKIRSCQYNLFYNCN